MKKNYNVVFFMTTILEHGGGFELYLMRTAREMMTYCPVNITIVTLDDEFSKKLGSVLQLVGLGKRSDSNMRKIQQETMSRYLGEVTYLKVNSIRQLASTLCKFDLVYSKNEILDAAILRLVGLYNRLPPIIFACGTPLSTPSNSMRDRIRNALYGGMFYHFLTRNAAAFHVKNNSDFRLLASRPRTLVPNSLDSGTNHIARIPIALNIIAAEKSRRSETSKTIISWVGRLSVPKGTDELISVIKKTNESMGVHEIEWRIAGAGEEELGMRVKLKNEPNVVFYGYLSNEKILELLENSDLFLSTSKWESFGQNVLEAQGAGVPVISFDINGPNEIIKNGVTGILVKNTDDMVNAIIDFSRGRFKFGDIRSVTLERYSPEVIYKQMFDLFNSVLKKESIKHV
jgi:hypothetical protein